MNSKQGIHCVKSDGTKGNPRSACEWTIPFRFDTEKMLYVVSTGSKLLVGNTNHSHALNLESIRASTRRLINFEKEMSDEEVAFIKELGPAMLGVTKVRDILRLKYPMCDYDGKLLSRLLQRGFVDHFGFCRCNFWHRDGGSTNILSSDWRKPEWILHHLHYLTSLSWIIL